VNCISFELSRASIIAIVSNTGGLEYPKSYVLSASLLRQRSTSPQRILDRNSQPRGLPQVGGRYAPASMEEAISKFVEGLESQERSGFDDIHRLVKGLPLPVTKAIRLMTHAQAIEAQFLPNMTEEEQKRFTPSPAWVV
jgi:hypothetical protein